MHLSDCAAIRRRTAIRASVICKVGHMSGRSFIIYTSSHAGSCSTNQYPTTKNICPHKCHPHSLTHMRRADHLHTQLLIHPALTQALI